MQQAIADQDWGKAQTALHDLIASEPSSASLHYNLGLVLKYDHKCAEAIHAFEEAFSLDKTHVNAKFELACCHMDMGHLAEACDCFKAFLSDVPDDENALLNLTRLYQKRGKIAKAKFYLKKLRRLNPENLDSILCAARIAQDEGEIDVANNYFAKIFAAAPPETKAVALKCLSMGRKGSWPLDARRLKNLGQAKT